MGMVEYAVETIGPDRVLAGNPEALLARRGFRWGAAPGALL